MASHMYFVLIYIFGTNPLLGGDTCKWENWQIDW